MKRWLVILGLSIAVLAGCGQGNANQPQVIEQQAEQQGKKAELIVNPGIVGPNTFQVQITDEQGQRVTTGKSTLHFSMAGMDHGKSELPLAVDTDGHWTAEGPNLMMDGDWTIELVWEDGSGNQTSFAYELTINP
ncbi:FixH family protein [Brevibacillus fulvus]|uniref:Nitrogen fixation protein FixH n=1 Tax=Brevibacillus fulvus TaxID=1125967 RepID=A0A938XWS5_9BACL|nr:FixH family protein [Brevibacillus fulvus]MBM7591622.1 nitrogen fixation protein FixH [Brevibacillus fulvus]